MKKTLEKQIRRARRKKRVRKKIIGTPDRPRLSVYRSINNIYAQLIDDTSGNTLVSACSLEKDVRKELNGKGGNVQAAKVVGQRLAQKAVENNIKQAVLDRGGYVYHGRVQQLAQAAREAGLKF